MDDIVVVIGVVIILISILVSILVGTKLNADKYAKMAANEYDYNKRGNEINDTMTSNSGEVVVADNCEYDRWGVDDDGYTRNGYDRRGYNRENFGSDGYDRRGYDHDGYGRNGLKR